MAVSQYSIFSSNDASGPGLLASTNGDLIRVLTACLVTGYSGVTAVNWTNPIATASNIASYRPPLGSRKILVVGDDGNSAVYGGARAAYFTGWRTLAGVGTPVGSGTGQFPTAAQYGSVGAALVFKSDTNGASRPWTIFADGYGFLLFTDITAAGGVIAGHGFGDIYSYNLSDDNRCAVFGNGSGGTNVNGVIFDRLAMATGSSTNIYAVATGDIDGLYMAGPAGSGGASTRFIPFGDTAAQKNTGGSGYSSYYGTLPLGPANSHMIAPVRLMNTSGLIRGRIRGLYHPLHPGINYSNGGVFNGGGDYAGKTFMTIGPGGSSSVNLAGSGFWIVETSNTLLNN